MEKIQIIASIVAGVCIFLIISGIFAWRELLLPKIIARLELPKTMTQFYLPKSIQYALWLHGDAGSPVPENFDPRIVSVKNGAECLLKASNFNQVSSGSSESSYCASVFIAPVAGDYRLEIGGNTEGIHMVSIREMVGDNKFNLTILRMFLSIAAIVGLVFSIIFIVNPHAFS